MSKRVISSDELIAMSNEEVAIELFFMIVKHCEKDLKDVYEIARDIEKHATEIERRVRINSRKEHEKNVSKKNVSS